MGFLTPRDTSFSDLYAVQARHIVDGARALTSLLGAPASEHAQIAETLHAIEQAADEATHELIARVNSAFITPFGRDDMHELAVALDDCIDRIDAAGHYLSLYSLDGLPAGVAAQISVISRMAELTARAMPHLRSPSELGGFWVEINRLENQATLLYRELRAEVLADESQSVARVFKLRDVLDELEGAADAFERVAHKVEAIAVKES